MSTPPSGFPLPNNPPQGQYYGGPPPPSNNNSGCWKAVGIGCGVLFLLAIIVAIFAVRMSSGLVHQGMQMIQAQKNGQQIQQAVVAYNNKNGKYPATLIDLVQDGEVNDPSIFNQPPDPPGRISWRYTKPAKDAPGDTPILTLPYTLTILGQKQQQDLVIDLDGSSPGQHDASPPGTST